MAMATEADEQNFWPGYVDTLVNMVMFLILLIVILAMAVMYFSIKAKNDALLSTVQLETPLKEAHESYQGSADEIPKNPTMDDMRKIINELQQKLYQSELQNKPTGKNPEVDTKNQPDRRIAQSTLLNPESENLNKIGKSEREIQATQEAIGTTNEGVQSFALRPSVIIVRFRAGFLELTDDEALKLKEIFVQHFDYQSNKDQRFVLTVDAVSGLTESNRMAFYRIASVRNRLMAVAGVPASKIGQKINSVPASSMSGVESLEVRISKVE